MRLINVDLFKVYIRHLRDYTGPNEVRSIRVDAQSLGIAAMREGDSMLQCGLEMIETVRLGRFSAHSGQNDTTDGGLSAVARLQIYQLK